MNLNKTFGRVATTLVAATMLASVSAVPAFAEDKDIYETGNTFTINKTLTVAANSLTPDVTFTFEVKGATADGTQKIGGILVESGSDSDVYMSNDGADFDTETTTEGTGVERTVQPKQQAQFTVDLSKYNHAGIYKYTVTENKSTPIEGVTYGTETKDLYVFIQNVTDEDGNPADNNDDGKTDLEVAYTMLVNQGEAADNATAKDDTFTNKYGKGSDDQPNVFDLTLTKQITGNAANMGDTFKFTITVDGNKDGEKYVMLKEDNTKIIITEGVPQEVHLGDDDSVTIYGLSESDSYTIVEDYENKVGYTTTATVNNGENVLEGSGLTMSYGAEDGEDIDEAQNVVYTNTKIASTPTGIVMNVAPYALLVVVAAAGCFVFLRKRRED